MTTAPRPLLRFVQLRRLGDEPAQTPAPCMTGPVLIDACCNFADEWSKEVEKALTTGDRGHALALYRARRDGPSAEGAAAARLALALLRLATLNQRLTVGALRERLRTLAQRAPLSPTAVEQALAEATIWAVDLLMLRHWLGRAPRPTSSRPGQVLRGIVLVRLARSRAEDSCRVRGLVAGQTLHLPVIPRPQPRSRPSHERLATYAALRRDLARMQSRSRASSRSADPTLAELKAAAFPDLTGSLEELERAAAELGLLPTTRASAMRRVLEVEAAEAQRLSATPHGIGDPGNPFELPDLDDAVAFPIVPVLDAQAEVLGRGDLMIIRTAHERYDVAELSHVENVLASETRQRTHVIDTATTETTTEASKTLEETTQDLETTEQNSLDRATQAAASSSSSMSLGVSVSGGLGPVQAGLDVSLAHSTSTSSSTSSAVNYAKTITERASETLRSEAAYRRTVTSTTRVTETNLHAFDNSAGRANIAGLYRWLNKVDRAQVYNYGERVMLAFFVPEPATPSTFLKQQAESVAAPVPPAAWLLDIEELDEENYVAKAARWDVLGVEPPPPFEVFASTTFVDPAARPYDYPKDATDKTQPTWGYSSYVGEVVVPEGYGASRAYVTVTWGLSELEYDATTPDEGTPPQTVQIAVGEHLIVKHDTLFELTAAVEGPTEIPLANLVAGPLPIGISADQRGGLTVVVRVRCQRTEDAYAAWRLRTYEAIRAGYLRQLDAYESELRLQQARRAYVATTSPETNRLIELQELTRGCQSILTGQQFDLFGAMDFPTDDVPRIRIDEARVEADYVQFFQLCFEWENSVYLFYPYQWAGRERWAELQGRASSDPLHQAFLQAGAARVVVPIREGYEHAVGSYLATSEVPTLQPQPWRKGTNPYPPINEVLADALDRPGEEVPVGDPWEVVTPTSLIYLQPGPELNP